jgi:hypothetical protein
MNLHFEEARLSVKRSMPGIHPDNTSTKQSSGCGDQPPVAAGSTATTRRDRYLSPSDGIADLQDADPGPPGVPAWQARPRWRK